MDNLEKLNTLELIELNELNNNADEINRMSKDDFEKLSDVLLNALVKCPIGVTLIEKQNFNDNESHSLFLYQYSVNEKPYFIIIYGKFATRTILMVNNRITYDAANASFVSHKQKVIFEIEKERQEQNNLTSI